MSRKIFEEIHSYTDKETVDKWFQRIKEHYDEQGRFYHNWTHVESLLSVFEQRFQRHALADQLKRPIDINSIYLAVFFHEYSLIHLSPTLLDANVV